MTSQARISKNGRSFDAVQTTNNDLGYLLRAVAPYIVALFPQKMFFLLLSLVMMDRLFLSLKLSLLACMRFVNCNSTTTYYSSTASYPKIIAVPYESKTTFIREQARQFLLFANRGKRAMRTTNRPHQTVIFEEQKSYTLSSKSKKAINALKCARKNRGRISRSWRSTTQTCLATCAEWWSSKRRRNISSSVYSHYNHQKGKFRKHYLEKNKLQILLLLLLLGGISVA